MEVKSDAAMLMKIHNILQTGKNASLSLFFLNRSNRQQKHNLLIKPICGKEKIRTQGHFGWKKIREKELARGLNISEKESKQTKALECMNKFDNPDSTRSIFLVQFL